MFLHPCPGCFSSPSHRSCDRSCAEMRSLEHSGTSATPFLVSLRYDDGTPRSQGKVHLWHMQLKLAEETPPASSSCLISPDP